jgi:hypothetical protein
MTLSNPQLLAEVIRAKELGQATSELGAMFTEIVKCLLYKSHFRGFTYLGDMEAAAVERLYNAGLSFDPAKSSNPFAYYAQIATEAFRLNVNGKADA